MYDDEMPVRLANSLMEMPILLRSCRTLSPSDSVCIRRGQLESSFRGVKDNASRPGNSQPKSHTP